MNKNEVNNFNEKKMKIKHNIDKKVQSISEKKNVYEIGKVIKIDKYMVEVTGLNNAAFFEYVTIEGKAIGYVSAIKPNSVLVAITKETNKITTGDNVISSGKEYKARFSPSSFGRVIDIFGNDLLVNKEFDNSNFLEIESENTSIIERSSVNRPLYTGIVGIDLIYPIGKGQRQLIVGDKKTGKTQIALDTIVNQKDNDIICIYVSIGKTKKEIKEIYNELSKKDAIKNTIILAATNDQNTPVLYLTPYFAMTISQVLMKLKKDVLVIVDDLKNHADAYREIALLSGKAPGRDAYPTDIFYAHSRMLEKGCQHYEGGSITILPLMETRGGDISDYITTNIVSITDGQIVLSKTNFDKGQKPAINYSLSVSRLGGAVQEDHIKKLGAKVRRELLSYLEIKEIYELTNEDEMSPELQNKMKLGKQVMLKFNQYKFEAVSPGEIINLFSEFK